MKPTVDEATRLHIGGDADAGEFSMAAQISGRRSACNAKSAVQLQLLPRTDRKLSSTRPRCGSILVSGLGGESDTSRLKEADHEWLVWRFGEDA
jgi:hypothetical protein